MLQSKGVSNGLSEALEKLREASVSPTHIKNMTNSVYVKKASPDESLLPQAVILTHCTTSTHVFIARGTGRRLSSSRKRRSMRVSKH